MERAGLDIWLVVMLAVLAGQLIKLLIYSALQRRLRLGLLGQSAGLPSAHAMCGGSLLAICWMRTGWMSVETSVALVFVTIAVFDAMRVRSAASEQRQVLRQLVTVSGAAPPWQRRVVDYLDVLAHAPSHVAMGLVWGFLFALAVGTV